MRGQERQWGESLRGHRGQTLSCPGCRDGAPRDRLLPEADFLYADTLQLKGIRFHFLAQTEREHSAFNNVIAEKEMAWMETYDPDEKVILCVIRDGGGISSYLIGGRMKNSEAFKRQKDAMSN